MIRSVASSAVPVDTAQLPASPGMVWRGGEARTWRHWAICFVAMAFLHVVPVILAVWWGKPVESALVPPSSAIMVDMAPIPAAPVAPPTEIPHGPEQRRVEESVEAPQPAKAPRLPQVPKAAATLVARQKSERRHVEDKTPVTATTAPPTAAAPPAAASVPTASPAIAPSLSAPDWQSLLLGQLERFKRYPGDAQARRQEGVVYLRFTMDREGRVIAFKIEKSSSYRLLDQEALALIQRAQPLPRPPSSVAGSPLVLVVPIEFFLSRRM